MESNAENPRIGLELLGLGNHNITPVSLEFQCREASFNCRAGPDEV